MQKASVIFDNEKDIVMHIAVLISIAMADGKFLDSERNFIEGLAASYSASYGTKSFNEMVACIDGLPKSAIEDWETSLSRESPRAKNLIKDMIALGHIDGDYCDSERQLVRQHAEKLHMDVGIVSNIEKAVENIISSTKVLNALIAG